MQTSAEGVNLIEVRWGKVTSVRIDPDTAMLERTLQRIAAKARRKRWPRPSSPEAAYSVCQASAAITSSTPILSTQSSRRATVITVLLCLSMGAHSGFF